MNAEPEFCPAKMACDARIADLEGELAAEREVDQRLCAQIDRLRRRGVEQQRALWKYEDRLAAVMRVTDPFLRPKGHEAYEAAMAEVRAAATGDTK